MNAREPSIYQNALDRFTNLLARSRAVSIHAKTSENQSVNVEYVLNQTLVPF